MRSLPFMPLYASDYLGDTKHLNAAQHGAYLLLLMHYWLHGELPKGDRALARIACMTSAQWARERPVIKAFFTDEWKNKRAEIELKRAVLLKSLKNSRGNPPKNVTVTSEISQSFQSSNFTPPQPQRKKEGRKQTHTRANARVACDCAPRAAVEFGLKQNWERSRVTEEWQRFRDYHLAHGKQPKNVMAAWRNWCRSPFRNSNGHPPQQAPRPGSREDRKEKTQHALKQVDAYLDQCDDKGPGSQANKTNARLIPFRKPR